MPKPPRTRLPAEGELPAIEAAEEIDDPPTRALSVRYIRFFGLDSEPLRMTTERRAFETWIGRSVDSGIGGAYAELRHPSVHLVLINLPRIDLQKPKSLEIVIAEEFLHMRNWIDGDRRRHAKHGHDRIAHWVAELTGASLEEIRTCLLPRATRPARFVYRCPVCRRAIARRRRGIWSCGSCAPEFDPRFTLVLERDSLDTPPG